MPLLNATWCWGDRIPASLGRKLLWCDKSTPVHPTDIDRAKAPTIVTSSVVVTTPYHHTHSR